MANKIYVKLEGAEGPLQVAGYEKCFEAEFAQEGGIRNAFSVSNTGSQSFSGTPTVGTFNLVLKNCTGKVSSKLQQDSLNATPLTQVTVYEVTKLKGKEETTYQLDYFEAHIISYNYDQGTRNVALELGSFNKIETTHFDVTAAGDKTPYKVSYDFTKEEVS